LGETQKRCLQEQGVTTLRDVLRNVAGISLAAGEDGSQGDNLTIRGFAARNGERSLLFDLDTAIQRINRDNAEHPAAVQLTGVYHNLLRRWAEA
jgi:outer membrane receptor protein involved in Fe transport